MCRKLSSACGSFPSSSRAATRSETRGQSASAAGDESLSQGSCKAPIATRRPCAIQKIAMSVKNKRPETCMNWCSKVLTRYPNTVMKLGISIVGAGRIGRALGRRLREQGWRIHSVVTRSESTARRAVRSIGGGSARGELSQSIFSAPVILIAVPESAIAEVVTRLASLGETELRGKIALHTSGALSSDVLVGLRSMGAAIGSIHPLQTFSGIGIPALEGRVFAIEGHAAAVMSAGHVLALQETAVRIFGSLGMKRQEALKALLPLARQVLENLERVGPRAAWTGPLSRSDYDVIALHEEALKSAPSEYLEAYRAVNRLAARVLARDADGAIGELSRISTKSSSQSKVRGADA